MSPEVFLSDIFDVARQNICCDISAVNSLSVLERKTKININCSVLHKTAVFYINCRLFRLFHIKWTSKKTLSNDMHSQKTVLHINCRLSCLRLTSTAVFHKTAVLHINCRLSVCLNLVEIKHMPKTQIKLFHAGLKITCKNVQTFPNLQLQI